MKPGTIWRGYLGAELVATVSRNTNRHQHAGSRFLLDFVSRSGASEKFARWENAKAYGSDLNPRIEWRLESI